MKVIARPAIHRWIRPGLVLMAPALMLGCSRAESPEPPVLAEAAGASLLADVEAQPSAESEGETGATDAANKSDLNWPTGTLVDRQGAVEVAVTPLGDRSGQSGRIVFEVAMNTHSVDLSMDLAQLATLETDTGLSMTAASWSGGSGHHVTGHLEFDLPQGEDAKRLATARRWVLTLREVDSPARVYEWPLVPSP